MLNRFLINQVEKYVTSHVKPTARKSFLSSYLEEHNLHPAQSETAKQKRADRRKSCIIFEKQHKLPQTQILDNSLAESLHFRHDIPTHGEVLGPDKLIYQDTKETHLRFHRFNKKDSFTYEETPLPWHFTDAIQRAQRSKSGVKFNEHVWMTTPQDTTRSHSTKLPA